MNKKKSLQNKIHYLQECIERLNDKSLVENIFSSYQKQYNNTNIETLITELNKINPKQISKSNKYLNYIEKHYSDYWNILTIREKIFILNYIEKLPIDLTEQQKYLLIDMLGNDFLHFSIHYNYVRTIDNQTDNFDLAIWEKLSKDKNFLDFITTVYWEDYQGEKIPFLAHSHYELINFYETFIYAKDRIPALKPYFYKLWTAIINNSNTNSPYPFHFIFGKKEFITEYIVKEPTLTKKDKIYILNQSHIKHFYIAILTSPNFTEQEKLNVINKIDYQKLINKFFYLQIFRMRLHLKDEYISIDAQKLLNLNKEEIKNYLNQVIDEKKIPNSYHPFYCQYFNDKFFYFKKDTISLEQLKKDYISNFIDSCEFLKKIYQLKPFSLETKIIKVTDNYGENHPDIEQDEIFQKLPSNKKEKSLIKCKKKIRTTERK